MFHTRTLIGLVVGATLLVSACTSGAAANPASTAVPAVASPVTGATVSAATAPSFGAILTGPDGRTLYTHTGDSMNASTCTGECLTEWPPLTIPAGQKPTAGEGVTGTLGWFSGPGGTWWVTYGGMPLYYWKGDTKPGDVTGQGIDAFMVAAASGTSAAPSMEASPPPASTSSY
jgi:predicted lipoprotein with Yx(FWY)xxD motif